MNQTIKWIAIALIGVAGLAVSAITHDVLYAEIGVGGAVVIALFG